MQLIKENDAMRQGTEKEELAMMHQEKERKMAEIQLLLEHNLKQAEERCSFLER